MEYKNTDSGFYESTKGRNGAMNVRTAASDIIQPVDIQAHYQQTIQTHTNIMVAPAASNDGAWIDTAGFAEVGLTIRSDSNATTNLAVMWSHDGTTIQGYELTMASGAGSFFTRSGLTQTKARYMRVSVGNGDTAPHTLSAWAFLKA